MSGPGRQRKPYLGEFEQLLLYALMQLGEGAYGAAIGALIRERTGRSPSAGAVYTALERLEARDLVASRMGEPTPERGGKRKRFYRLRPAGLAALRDAHEAMRRMAEGLAPRLETS